MFNIKSNQIMSKATKFFMGSIVSSASIGSFVAARLGTFGTTKLKFDDDDNTKYNYIKIKGGLFMTKLSWLKTNLQYLDEKSTLKHEELYIRPVNVYHNDKKIY